MSGEEEGAALVPAPLLVATDPPGAAAAAAATAELAAPTGPGACKRSAPVRQRYRALGPRPGRLGRHCERDYACAVATDRRTKAR